MVGNQAISPPVLLSPLAGITDLPFRNLVSSFGAGLVVSEMVASHEMMQKGKEAHARAELGLNVKIGTVPDLEISIFEFSSLPVGTSE